MSRLAPTTTNTLPYKEHPFSDNFFVYLVQTVKQTGFGYFAWCDGRVYDATVVSNNREDYATKFLVQGVDIVSDVPTNDSPIEVRQEESTQPKEDSAVDDSSKRKTKKKE